MTVQPACADCRAALTIDCRYHAVAPTARQCLAQIASMKLSGSPEEVSARAKELALLKEESATANGGPELLGLRVCADKSLAETPTEGRDEWRGVLLSAWAWTPPKGDAGRAHDLEMRFDKLSDEAEKVRHRP